MTRRQNRFNTIFAACLATLLGAASPGCRSSPEPGKTKSGKEATVIRFYVETNPDPSGHHMTVVIGRNNPFQLTVSDQPFLSEVYLSDANLVEVVGGFEIHLKFDRHGSLVLEQATAANLGRHFAIFSQFSDARWLAAPVVSRRISDGVLNFTPDATREEAERIVRGLLNIAKEVRKDP